MGTSVPAVAVARALGGGRMPGVAERQRISSGSPFEPTIGFSRAVRVGDRVVVSGTGPVRAGRPLPRGRGRPGAAVLRDHRAALAEAGASLDDVVRTRMYITSAGDADAVGAVHGELLGHVRPAATMVVVAGLLDPAWKVEIEAEAVLPCGPTRRGPLDGGGDDVGAAQVADEARLHAVHDVADGELRVLVDDDDRAAVAAPVTGARAERHLGRVAQPVAHADALGHAEHLVDAVRLHLEDRVGARGREQAHAAGLAPSGDDRLDGGHRAGIALAVGGGDLGAPPPFVMRHRGVDGRVHERLEHELGDLALHGGDVDRRRRDDVGHAVVLARREADEEVRIERLGHLAGEPGADARRR